MSKQYKLLKLYPSLPSHWKVGDIVEKETCKEELVSVSVYRNINRMSCGHCLINEVENNPEFWKKVEQKDYEILQLICKDNDSFYNKILEPKENGLWQWEDSNKGTCTLESLLECKNNYLIHKVKRLSDGEVFTVGDKLNTPASNSYCSIYSFKVRDDKLAIDHTHGFLLDKKYPETKYGHHLPLIEHVRKPLFTTDDGVDIYEGDTYYFISPQKDRHIRKVSNARNSTGSYALGYFKSKQKAREWLDENEPIYSKKDIKEAIDYSKFNGVLERFANINLKSFWKKLNDN